MALRKAGISLTLEGQAAYKAGLAEINREQRLLSEQSKLAVAQLGTQASRQQTYSTNMDNYSKRIQVAADKTDVFKNRQKELPGIQNQISKSLKDTNAAYQDSAKNTERLKNNYEQMRSALGKNNEATLEAKAAYQASKEETKALGTEVKNLEKAYGANEKELSNLPFALNKAELATQELRNEAQRLHEEYRNAGGRLADVSAKFNSFGDTMIGVGDKMKTAGSFATKFLTVPLALGSLTAIKAAIDYESAFAGVKKTVDEVYDANGNLVISYDDLSKGIREMSKELPATASEISEVAESAGQLGIQTENVLSFSKTMIDMGESTNLGANEAATALARFANITGMSQDKFSNLGASIVDLGNNFATTESEIVAMAVRLAGAGSQIGMSEADILGLSAALSSVGIEAEAGGSAFSKIMVEMQLATAKGVNAFEGLQGVAERNGISWDKVTQAYMNGGKELTNMSNKMGLGNKGLKDIYKVAEDAKASLGDFGYVAGMTGDEFAKAFEEDAVGAIAAFVQGLGNAEDKGTTAIEMLDNMGISEVRLRDALLRAGNASDLFAGAIETSNKAFKENTALTEEAGKRYETTEAKLSMLKNEATDVAIEMGGPLVDALRDGLEAAKPLIEGAGNLAESFSNLDEGTQKTIIKWGLLAMAGGPVLSMLGNITGGFGVASKGVGSLVEQYGKLTTPKLESDMNNSFTKVAGGATGLTTKIGGLITTIGGMPVVLGVAGAALLGWTAWKVWGEDAWEASQRTKQWGTDVGETVDGHLSKMQELTQTTSGQFENMTSGLSTNKNQMSNDFVELGQTIESSLNERISKLDELMANLPETVRTTLTELLSEDKKKAEESLKIVEDNNKRIQEINARAANENRNATISENQIILDLNRESAEAYVNTLQISKEERNNILNAMNGDVEKSTKEQAVSWAKSLAEQRQEMKTHYSEQKEAYLSSLEELGYSPKAIEEQAKIWDKANEATTNGIDQQLAIIAAKYPEIAKEISLTNGQTIESMGELGEQQVTENEKIIQRAGSLSKELASSAEENAKKLSWVADESKAGAKTWNDIILDPKTGELKTNVREEVIKAGEDVTSWNEMRFQLHNADLSSNAKSIIGESAIVNGWWDGMAWEDKAVILEDEFSQTTYKALEQSGKWNEMSLEEKTAIMYSNTPEKMTETLAYLNLWEEFEPDIKEVNADNAGFIQSIMDSEEKMNYWRSIPDETKDILGENYDLLTTIFQSEEAYNNFKSLSDEEKIFLGENSDLMSAVLQSKESYNNWISMPDNEKRLLANNTDLMTKVFSSQKSYNEWRGLPDTLKKITATSNVPGVSEQSIGALNKVPGLKQVDILAKTNAWAIANSAIRAINSVEGKTVSVTTQFKTIGSPAGAGYAKGTNYHPGGSMIVNDQKGPLFKELVSFPNGKSFVPEGRNVLIPDAPKGTKVLKAALTKRLIPKYEKGIGYDEQSIKSASSQPAVSINIEINDPVVREEQDINKISNAVVEKITLDTRLKNLFNKGKGGAYA